MKHHRSHPNRKYRIALLSFFLITVAYFGTSLNDRLKDSFFTYIGGVSTILTLYGAANVSNKYVLAKHGILTSAEGETSAVITNSENKIVRVPDSNMPKDDEGAP